MNATSTQRVLIADHNRINRRLLGGMLSPHGLEVLEANDGAQALSAALTDRPELILLDFEVPVIDALEVCSQLKRHADTRDVPVILLSAKDDAEHKMEGLRQGAVDFVRKPFDRSEVLARVGSQLRQRRLFRSLGEANGTIQSQHAIIEGAARMTAETHRSLLPRTAAVDQGSLRWAWRQQSRAAVSGDLFGILPLDGCHTAMFILDVAGHDVGAGLLAISIAQRLAGRWREAMAAGEALAPAAMLRRLSFEYPMERFDRTLTLACLMLDEGSGRLRYSSAGHPPPLLVTAGAEVRRLEQGGPPIGVGVEAHFDEGEVQLAPSDRLVLYTDGVLAASGEGVPWGLEGLEGLEGFARTSRHETVEAMACTFERALGDRREGAPRLDDVTFVALDWAP